MNAKPDTTLDVRLALAAEAFRKTEERATAGQLALEMVHEVKNALEALGHLVYLALAESHDHEQVESTCIWRKSRWQLFVTLRPRLWASHDPPFLRKQLRQSPWVKPLFASIKERLTRRAFIF